MDAEYDAAAARFEADLVIAAGTALRAVGTHRLRRRVVSVYRNALNTAAGRPHDPRWQIFELMVDAFVERISTAPRTPEGAAALERLHRLQAE
jgi:hypothetical protein